MHGITVASCAASPASRDAYPLIDKATRVGAVRITCPPVVPLFVQLIKSAKGPFTPDLESLDRTFDEGWGKEAERQTL